MVGVSEQLISGDFRANAARVRVEPFVGDARELADFINAAWMRHHKDGTWITLYDQKQLEWEILHSRESSGAFHLAAYDDQRLVGCFLAEKRRFFDGKKSLEGTQASWFSVLPEYASSRTGIKLVNAMAGAHREHGMQFLLGYVNSDPRSPAFRFWTGYQRTMPKQLRTLEDVTFWFRVLDVRTLTSQLTSWVERLQFRVLSLLTGAPAARDVPGVRPYRSEDLESVLSLLDGTVPQSTLTHVWCARSLAHQLRHDGVADSLLFERDGEIQGLLNYYHATYSSRGPFHVGKIDILEVSRLSHRETRQLLERALFQMRAEGVALVSLSARSHCSARALFGAGFYPVKGICKLVALFSSGLAESITPFRLVFR